MAVLKQLQPDRYAKRTLAITSSVVLTILSAMFGLGGCSDTESPVEPPSETWETIIPEDAGWSTSRLQHAVEYADTIGYCAAIFLSNDKLMYAWGDTGTNYWAHSIRKPLLNSLYGIHLVAGTIDLQANLGDLGIDDIPPSLTDTEKTATVQQLLQSRSGVYHVAAAEDSFMILTRPARGSHDPGTFFYYNNFDFNVAGTILQDQIGNDIFSEFQDRIAQRLGMEDFDKDLCFFQFEPGKSLHPAYHMRISARDLARYGLLYLQLGLWRGERILTEEWIAESTTAYSEFVPGMGIGYGYLWRVIVPDTPFGDMLSLTRNAFYHTGAGVQMIHVIPDWNLVMVFLMDTESDTPRPTEEQSDRLTELIIAARATYLAN